MNIHFARDGGSIVSLISHNKRRKFLESMEVSFYFVHKNAIGSTVSWKYRYVPGSNSKADPRSFVCKTVVVVQKSMNEIHQKQCFPIPGTPVNKVAPNSISPTAIALFSHVYFRWN